MKLAVTGGGTGGHVYPALEIALAGRDDGLEVEYLGSFRGQERGACEKVSVPFFAVESGPVYRPLSLSGVRSLARLWRAGIAVGARLRENRPDVVFATGGYSAAPVLMAARRAGIPIVLHEQNSVPGRTNRLTAKHAFCVCTVFNSTAKQFPGSRIERVGMPIRKILRETAGQGRLTEGGTADPTVLVMGGSQGSAALNDQALSTALRMSEKHLRWLHITGLGHFESTTGSLAKMGIRSDYKVKAYLEAPEMADAMFAASVALCRSGAGTLAELAAFRKPSILVPFPSAFGNHQLHNAEEFVQMGAADIVPQDQMEPALLEGRILSWLYDRDRQIAARDALAQWDVPDSIPRILGIIREAARR